MGGVAISSVEFRRVEEEKWGGREKYLISWMKTFGTIYDKRPTSPMCDCVFFFLFLLYMSANYLPLLPHPFFSALLPLLEVGERREGKEKGGKRKSTTLAS